MAKRIDNSENQGNQYMKNLLGNREIVPLGAPQESKTTEPESGIPVSAELQKPAASVPAAVQQLPVQQYPVQQYSTQPLNPYAEPQYFRKKETKMRASFTILPSDFKKLKRIAYINRMTISSIIDDYIKRYIALHTDELDQFDKLSDSEKARADME